MLTSEKKNLAVAVAVAACEMTENDTRVNRGVEMMLLIKDGGEWKIVAASLGHGKRVEADPTRPSASASRVTAARRRNRSARAQKSENPARGSGVLQDGYPGLSRGELGPPSC
jgi:hypothetical protein